MPRKKKPITSKTEKSEQEQALEKELDFLLNGYRSTNYNPETQKRIEKIKNLLNPKESPSNPTAKSDNLQNQR